MKQLLTQAARFFVVGISAMASHFLIFIALGCYGIPPLIANVIAFLGAFQVSFWGHFRWSFKETSSGRRASMIRFFTVSSGCFILNELMFAGFLIWTPLPEEIALLIVLFTVAGITFILSRYWAFAKKKQQTTLPHILS